MNTLRSSLGVRASARARALVFVAVLAAVASPALAQTPPAASSSSAATRANSTGGRSPHETTSTVIGDRRTGNRVTITYGRPYLKHPQTGQARKAWGGELAPWDKPYRLGADEATLLLTQQPIQIGDTTVPPGAYTLYMIPSESGASKLAFSTNIGKWGVPIDETKDLARFDLKKEPLEQTAEQLTIAIEKVPGSETDGVIRISWENTQFSLPFTVKK